jgi:hypothetical protein
MSVIVADARPQLIAARLAEPEGLAPSLMRLRAGDGVFSTPFLPTSSTTRSSGRCASRHASAAFSIWGHISECGLRRYCDLGQDYLGWKIGGIVP